MRGDKTKREKVFFFLGFGKGLARNVPFSIFPMFLLDELLEVFKKSKQCEGGLIGSIKYSQTFSDFMEGS